MSNKTYQAFTVSTDDRFVTTVTIDVPERPLNVFDGKVIKELDQIVHDVENDPNCRMVVFRSGKESGFLAGADVQAIANIESPAKAMRLIEVGQQLFDRIQWLSMPTIAVIHGPCLGGGLEWTLACDYRIARDNSSTILGLPEIKLGLIPGWGGTQRLPRLVGLTDALAMIMQGKQLSAGEAFKIGLVDGAIRPDEWENEIGNFISLILAGGTPDKRHAKHHARNSFWKWLAEHTRTGRKYIFAATEKRIASKAKQYPALQAALNAVKAGYGLRPDGFKVERDEFVDLLATPTCRNLMQIFFARESARSPGTWSTGKDAVAHEEPIRKVAVIGAGAMGAGIGQLAACRGYDVVLKEINEEAAMAGLARVDSLLDKMAKHKSMTGKEREQIADRICVTTSDEDLADVDLVVEAVVELEDVKRNVFATLDRVTARQAILATNTSSLSVAKMAHATERPGLVAGLHFFNPVHKMELVEVVRAADTDDSTVARLVSFVRALGKTPVVTSDSPGFLVNRVLFPYLGEAVLMVAQGHDVESLDKQVRRFGMPMGPLELLDQVGLDVAMHVARSLVSVLPGVGPVAEQLAMMIDLKMLGQKSGVGFYQYQNGRRHKVADIPRMSLTDPNAQRLAETDQADSFLDDGLTHEQRRLIYPMLAESIRCKEESVVQESWAIDLAMVLGTGFAPHRGGPLHVVDAIGQRVVNANLERLQTIHGDRFSPPESLSKMADTGLTFFGEQHAEAADHPIITSS